MSRKREVEQQKVEAAREYLLECLSGIEAAVGDFRQYGACIERASVVETSIFRHRLQNKILMVALSLQRLEDATRRLLKRLGQDTRLFDTALRASIPIQVTSRLANSWKHGLGGQNKNATLLNGVTVVHRADGFRDASGEERVHVVGMLVTDATKGTFPSSTLLSSAVREWSVLLQAIIPEAQSWAERLLPKPKGPVVTLPQGVNAVVPLGATVVFDLPEELRATLAAEAKKRGESA